MGKCQAINQSGPNKGERHNSNGGTTISHGDHTHLVCKTHAKATEFHHCPTPKVEQQQFPIPNPEAAEKVQQLRAQVFGSKKAELEARGMHVAASRIKGIVEEDNSTTAPSAPISRTALIHCHMKSCKVVEERERGFFCCGKHESCSH